MSIKFDADRASFDSVAIFAQTQSELFTRAMDSIVLDFDRVVGQCLEWQENLDRSFQSLHEFASKMQAPILLEQTIKDLQALNSLLPDTKPPQEIVRVRREIDTELIKYLAKHPEALYEIKPRQFEELIAEILASYGWDVQLTPAVKDGGYDVFCISKRSVAGVTTSLIIECKKYAKKKKVGVDVVRALYGVKTDLRISHALLATTSHFTKGVRDFKDSKYNLELRDYEGIIEWLNEYKPNPNGRLYIKDNRLVVPGEGE